VLGGIPGLGGLGGRFRAPSEKRAKRVVGPVVASANAGNLTAVKAIEHRSQPGFGIAKERAVWQAAWTQVPKKLKDLLKKYADLVPDADHTNPETAAATALSLAVDVNELEEAAREETRASKAERAAIAREERAARQQTLGTLAGVAEAGLTAFGRRSLRRPTRRRTRRRRRSY
jgi:hypothetical protein